MAVKKTYYHSDDGNYFELTEYSSYATCEIHDKNGKWCELVEGKDRNDVSDIILSCMPYDAYFFDHEIVKEINSHRDWKDYIKTGKTPAELEEEERKREEAELAEDPEFLKSIEESRLALVAKLETAKVERMQHIAAQEEAKQKAAEEAKRLDEEKALQEALEIANSIVEEQGGVIEEQPVKENTDEPVKEEPVKENEDIGSKEYIMPDLDATPVTEYTMPDLDDISIF